MITIEQLFAIKKEAMSEESKKLDKEDIAQLVDLLTLKDDQIRYQAFLLLQNRAAQVDDVYQYWDIFQDKLKSDNSYQRNIGLMLIAENARWDTDDKMANTIDEYLDRLHDEKPITIRQCIQSLGIIVPYKPDYINQIKDALMQLDIMSIKDTMRKSILLDIINVLLIIRDKQNNSGVEPYILNALTGEVLDKKAKKQIEAVF
jgi:hypothetical protein